MAEPLYKSRRGIAGLALAGLAAVYLAVAPGCAKDYKGKVSGYLNSPQGKLDVSGRVLDKSGLLKKVDAGISLSPEDVAAIAGCGLPDRGDEKERERVAKAEIGKYLRGGLSFRLDPQTGEDKDKANGPFQYAMFFSYPVEGEDGQSTVKTERIGTVRMTREKVVLRTDYAGSKVLTDYAQKEIDKAVTPDEKDCMRKASIGRIKDKVVDAVKGAYDGTKKFVEDLINK